MRAFCGHGKKNDCGGLANLAEYEPVGLLFRSIEVRLNVALAKASWKFASTSHSFGRDAEASRLHIRLCRQDLIETLPDGAMVAMIAAIAAASVAKDLIRAAIAPIRR